MAYDTTIICLMQGNSVVGFCNINYLTQNKLSYILIAILVIGILWYGRKKNYTIYTLMPITFTSVFFISLFIYTLDCTYQPAIHGSFVVVSLFLLAISVFVRKMTK